MSSNNAAADGVQKSAEQQSSNTTIKKMKSKKNSDRLKMILNSSNTNSQADQQTDRVQVPDKDSELDNSNGGHEEKDIVEDLSTKFDAESTSNKVKQLTPADTVDRFIAINTIEDNEGGSAQQTAPKVPAFILDAESQIQSALNLPHKSYSQELAQRLTNTLQNSAAQNSDSAGQPSLSQHLMRNSFELYQKRTLDTPQNNLFEKFLQVTCVCALVHIIVLFKFPTVANGINLTFLVSCLLLFHQDLQTIGSLMLSTFRDLRQKLTTKRVQDEGFSVLFHLLRLLIYINGNHVCRALLVYCYIHMVAYFVYLHVLRPITGIFV